MIDINVQNHTHIAYTTCYFMCTVTLNSLCIFQGNENNWILSTRWWLAYGFGFSDTNSYRKNTITFQNPCISWTFSYIPWLSMTWFQNQVLSRPGICIAQIPWLSLVFHDLYEPYASLTLARLLATILSWQVVPFLGHELGGYCIVHD